MSFGKSVLFLRNGSCKMNSKSFRNQQSLKQFTRREGTQAERSSSVCTCDSNQNNCSSTSSVSISRVCVDGLFVRLCLFSSNHLSVKTCLSTMVLFSSDIIFQECLFKNFFSSCLTFYMARAEKRYAKATLLDLRVRLWLHSHLDS